MWELFWGDKRMRTIYLIGILLAASWGMFAFITPIQGTKLGFSASTIGLIMGCFSLATFVIRFMMPYLYGHFSPWKIITATMIIACMCFALFPWQHVAGRVMLLAFVLGLGLGASQPNMLNLLFQAAPGRAGEALGLRVTIGNGTQAVLPLVFGFVGAGIGLLPVFGTMCVLLLGGLLLVWRSVLR
jgi:MFS family permease